MQGDEVAHLAPYRRHADLEPALRAAVAMPDADNNGAPATGDTSDPVPGAEVVDVEVERSRMHDDRG